MEKLFADHTVLGKLTRGFPNHLQAKRKALRQAVLAQAGGIEHVSRLVNRQHRCLHQKPPAELRMTSGL